MLIIQRVEEIAQALSRDMDKLTIKFKSSDATDSYKEATPKVYSFTYDDLDGSMPLNTPSVLVQFMGMDSNDVASFLVHVCICNPALQDKEIVNPLEGQEGVYEYQQTDGIDSARVRSELYRACLMLGEQVWLSLKRMSNINQSISNLEFNPPNPYLENFPYCDCTISFESEITCSKMFGLNNTDVSKLL